MNQYVRLAELDRQIREGQFPNPDSLAEQFKVSPRLISLDCSKLVKMGAPVKWDKQRRGWYFSDTKKTWRFPAVHFKDTEILAFYLAVQISKSSSNPAFEKALQSAVSKIAQSVGDVVTVDIEALRTASTYSFSPAARIDAEIHLQLHRAVAGRQKISMRYFTASRGQWSDRIVHPHHLHFTRGEWILIAFDENKRALRCFNIARIARHQTLNAHFERQSDFNAKEYVRTMFFAEVGDQVFEVVVRFDEYQARYIREREWHPEQKLQEQPDGGAILRFPASGLQEIARWILGYGQHATALEPPELRHIIREHVNQMVHLYNS